MLAYTVISAFALVIMILTFLYFVIKFVDFPIDQFKKLFVKKKHDNKSLNDDVSVEKTVKNKIKRAESRRRNRINYLRSFKRGKGLVFYFIAIPLLFIGILYSGSSPILAITTTIARVIDLLVLKYNHGVVAGLFDALPIYRVAICVLYVLIFLNAVVFVLSLAHQVLCKAFYDFKFKVTKKEKVFLFGNNNQNKTIYKNSEIKEKLLKSLVLKGKENKNKLIMREIRILDNLSKEDEKDLFLSNIRYKNIKNEDSYLESIFDEISKRKRHNNNEKKLYNIIINTGNAERNVSLTRKFVDKIKALDETSRELFYKILHIYVYSEPSHESIYEEFCLSAGGCLSYFNKYKRIALDFISKYPFSMYMNGDEIDEKTHVLKKEAEINAFLVGFGKTNQQIYLASVANNQYLTTDDNNMLVQKNVNYYIYDKANFGEVKNLNHSIHRYKNERQYYDKNDYLELPEVPWNEVIEKCDINDAKFYTSLKKHVSAKKASINFVIIAFGTDLENIDMAHKILELSYDWGIDDIWVFVKVRDSKNHNAIKSGHITDQTNKYFKFKQEHCYVIGNEDHTVFDLDHIINDKYVDLGISQHTLYLISKEENKAKQEKEKERLEIVTDEKESSKKEKKGRKQIETIEKQTDKNEVSEEEKKKIEAKEKEEMAILKRKQAEKEWLTTMLPIIRYSNIYSVLSLRSKLNLLGFDYKKKENIENQNNKNGIGNTLENAFNDSNANIEFLKTYYQSSDGSKKKNSDELYTIKPVDQMSIRDIYATLEHLRWNAFMIAHGLVPSTIEDINKPNKGKDYSRRMHSNITTMKGLIDFRKIVAKNCSTSEKEEDTIKNDYDALDNATNLLDKLGYKIVKKKTLK